jgi:RNA polymerase sigma factor (sigma-70 family)
LVQAMTDAREQQAVRALTLARRTALALLGPGDEAREVAQEVAARVLERRSQLRDPEKFDAWVHRVTVRETLQRQRRRRRRHEAEDQLDEQLHEAVGSVADPAELVDVAATARAALARLGERERLSIVLHYVHDLPDREIATILDCRRGTVNSLLSRARARLRSMPELELLTSSDRGEQR